MADTAPIPSRLVPRLSGTVSVDRRFRRIAVAITAFVLVYVSWQLFGWIPGSREHTGDLLILPADGAAIATSWYASRRCAEAGGLRTFWRLLTVALLAEALGDVVQATYDIGLRQAPYPSLADPLYLAFYPLLLYALWRVPVPPVTRSWFTKTVLDGATIVVGGGAIVWYFVLGPTTLEVGQSALAVGVSAAFPIGDLFLLAGIAAVLLRQSPPALRSPLALITVAVLLGIVADVFYGYGQLHGTYAPGSWIDTVYLLEFVAFTLAGASQRRMRRDDPDALVNATSRFRSRASWLPYLSVAVGLCFVLGVEREDRFFPNVSLLLIVIVLAVLVAARQYAAQRELVRAESALRESERLKDELLSVVGHELRTPLTSIRGSLGLLDGGVLGELPAEAANMVAVAVLNADRLVRLINDILDVERMNAGILQLEPTAVDARRLVREALQAVQATADAAGVTLRCDIAPLTVMADGDRVVQALVNLVGNAVKFSARGGVVSISARRQEHRALLSVRDGGRGIPADQLESIFERFRQVDASDAREKGGTGLGLPIARGIVERHGGRMWAESGEGEGATFRFTLP
ncbi:MAG TPA: HAMP domain-containing sensor histidine kinase, partial [Solirubrobacteraceae bacterium]|nr:HAMP domain-containing sensor histidine kinase [Solirubrobacteraceae bacterium]